MQEAPQQLVAGSFEQRPGGASMVPSSMASRVAGMGNPEQQAAPTQNSQAGLLPRADTLDTLNTCLESLDQLKAVVNNIDDSVPAHSMGSQAMPLSVVSSTSNTGPSEEEERQAARQQLLQQSRSKTPPRASPNSSFSVAPNSSFAAPTGSFAAPAGSFAAPTGSFAAPLNSSFAAAPNGSLAAPPSASLETSSQRPAGSESVSAAPQGSFAGPYPGLNMNTSLTSYAVGGTHVTESGTFYRGSAPSTKPATGCEYKVGDPVEIYSKSSGAWVQGGVVRVEGWKLTVQYGDRERKVDLQAAGVSEFFRSAQHYTRTGAPVFDSMLNNSGSPQRPDLNPLQAPEAIREIPEQQMVAPSPAPAFDSMLTNAQYPGIASSPLGSTTSLESKPPLHVKAAVL